MTHRGYITFRYSFSLLASLGALSLPCAHADELDNIQRDREAAEMQYINEMATGKYTTDTQKQELRAKLLEPQEKRAQDYFKKISEVPKPKEVTAADMDLSRVPQADISAISHGDAKSGQSGSSASSGGSVSGRSTSGVPSSEKAPLRPEFVLDGSKVPKEVDFTPEKKAPAPAASKGADPKKPAAKISGSEKQAPKSLGAEKPSSTQ